MHKCNCGREFEKKGSLTSHARFCKEYVKEVKPQSKYKITEGLYKCECDKTFSNSQSLNAHFSHCLIHREGSPETRSHVIEGRMAGWDKFSEEEIEDIRLKSGETVREKYASGEITSNWLGKKHADASRKLMSEKRIKYMEENPGLGIEWYTVNGIKVQGKWEKLFAERLNELNVSWTRISLEYLKTRKYTPDFYLHDYDMYVEIKGWLRERDKYKMLKVLDEHNIDLRIIESLETITTFEVSDIEKFEIFNQNYTLDDVDFSKFANQWD